MVSLAASTDHAKSGNGAPLPLRLYCLGGGEAPPDLGEDLRRLLLLPAPALQKLWQVLAPSLADQITPETSQLIDLFCAAYHVDGDALALAIKACRFVIREAARLDIPAGALAEDLDRLCPDDPLVKELLLVGYDPAREHVRREIIKAALVDHGKLLVALNWRVDAVQASERGMRLGMPVAMLTLHYREGAESGRITLQVLPDMLNEIKGVCEKILG
jgi:hypothetical protein